MGTLGKSSRKTSKRGRIGGKLFSDQQWHRKANMAKGALHLRSTISSTEIGHDTQFDDRD